MRPSTLHTRRQRSRHIGLLLLVMLGSACDSQPAGLPVSWGPLTVSGDDTRCPDVAGTYVSWVREGAADAVFPSLIRPKLTSYELMLQWDELDLLGDANRGLTAKVRFVGGQEDSMQLVRGADYRCQDGWLVASTPYGVVEGDDDIPREEQSIRPDAREVFLARGGEQSLIARLETREEHKLTVWCGDGCKGIILPWRTRRAVTWSRMIAQIDPAQIANAEDSRASSLSDSARVVQLAQRCTPPGTRLLSTTSLGGTHWRLRFRAARDVEHQAVIDELMTAPFFADVVDETVDGTRLPDGAIPVVAFVRLVR